MLRVAAPDDDDVSEQPAIVGPVYDCVPP
jgi:hypothetical protein